MMTRLLFALAVLVSLAQAPVPITDQARLQSAVSVCGYVRLEPRVYHLTAPITLPNCPLRLEGVRGATVLQWAGGDGFTGAYPGYYSTMPITIRDVTLGCAGTCGTAVRLAWPDATSVNEPTAILEAITIRPEPTTGMGRSWARGVELINGWYARLTDVVIHSDNHDAESLDTAITLRGWSTGVRITDTLIYGGRTGILIDATEVGHGEGPQLARVEMVDVGMGLHARSALAGGRPTPMLMLSDCHIAARRVGVMFEGRTQGSIATCLIYGVPGPGQTFVGIYLAAQSHHTRVMGNQVYVLQPGAMSYGILADASSGGTMTGNVLTGPGASPSVGIWLTPSTAGWQVGLNAISGMGWYGVLNQGTP